VNPDFRDLLRALSDAGARFLVVGAYAVSFHSEPRATGDLDIWIDPARDMTSITGVNFADAWPARTEATYGDAGFPIIGVDALIKNKQALGRPKDLVDLDLLRRHHRR
jgi:hypothetical protein